MQIYYPVTNIYVYAYVCVCAMRFYQNLWNLRILCYLTAYFCKCASYTNICTICIAIVLLFYLITTYYCASFCVFVYSEISFSIDSIYYRAACFWVCVLSCLHVCVVSDVINNFTFNFDVFPPIALIFAFSYKYGIWNI